MVNLRGLAIPAIIVLLVGGTISFFMAFSFYPEKHVNIKINGECYEFLDEAYVKYKKLQAEKELLIFRLQANAIELPNTVIPVIFSGAGEEVNDFANRYDIK
ncbi:MAG TPA: hypothetical protein VE524_03490, partial [Nitrososphaeraceae archaeon]|nr:hypothetical protein [Nitrososphaeraceae archaeon]